CRFRQPSQSMAQEECAQGLQLQHDGCWYVVWGFGEDKASVINMYLQVNLGSASLLSSIPCSTPPSIPPRSARDPRSTLFPRLFLFSPSLPTLKRTVFAFV